MKKSEDDPRWLVRSEQDTASGKISFTQGPVGSSDLVLDDDNDDGNALMTMMTIMKMVLMAMIIL